MDILAYTLSKRYTDEAIRKSLADIGGIVFEVKIVDSLPEEGVNGVLYLVPAATNDGANFYNEFVWVASASTFEPVGNTKVDLSEYSTIQQVTNEITAAKEELIAAINLKENSTEVTSKFNHLAETIQQLDTTIKEYSDNADIALKTEIISEYTTLLTTIKTEIETAFNNELTTTKTDLETLINSNITDLRSELTTYTDNSVSTARQELIELINPEVKEVKDTVQNVLLPKVEDEIIPTVTAVKTKVETEILPAVETVAELRTWVENKEYLQDIDLDGYATETYVDAAIKGIEIPEAEIYKVDFNAPDYTKAVEAYNNGKVLVLINAAPDINSYAVMNYVSEKYITFTKFLTSRSEAYGSFNTYYLSPANTWEVSKEVRLNKVEANPSEEAAGELNKVRIGKEIFTIPQAPSLAGYATEEFVNKKILEAEIADKEADLEAYYTKSEVDAKIPDVSEFIKEIPVEYITEEELNAKGYLTEHQSLEGYAKLTDIPSHDSLATKEELEKVQTVAGNNSVLLRDVDSQLFDLNINKADKSELFSKSYNDLTDKPEIPSIEGLASEQFVTDKIAAIPPVDLSNYATLADLQIGEDFVTETTVGFLKAGTQIKATMTLGSILKSILCDTCPHEWIDATCTTPKTCKLCGKTEGEALGHTTFSRYENINGSLFYTTYCSECNEKISSEAVKEKTVPVSNENDLVAVLTTSTNAKLIGDLVLAKPILLEGNIETTIDLDGKTLSINDADDQGVSEIFWVKDGAKLTIKGNGILETTNPDVDYSEVLFATDGAVVNIENGVLTSAGCTAVYATRGAVVNIYGGTYEAKQSWYGDYYTLDVNEGDIPTGTINVYGGTFVNFDPANHTNDGASYTNKVADGYHSIEVAPSTYEVGPHVEEIIPGKAATCTETGLTNGRKCSVCGKILVEQQIIPVVAHKQAIREENRVEPDCTTDGSYEKVTYCTECGEVLSRETIVLSALGHDYGDWVITKQPEVGVPGEQTKTCRRCGDVVTEEIPALPQPDPTEITLLTGTFGNVDLQEWPEPFIADWTEEEQEEISMHYVNNMSKVTVSSEDELLGRHGFVITTPFVKESNSLAAYGEVSEDPFITRPAIVLPVGYEVTAWNTDVDNSSFSECTVYSYELNDGRVVYYAGGFNQETGITNTHYLTIIKTN